MADDNKTPVDRAANELRTLVLQAGPDGPAVLEAYNRATSDARAKKRAQKQDKQLQLARGDGTMLGPPTLGQMPGEDTTLTGMLPDAARAVIGGAQAGMMPFGIGDPEARLNGAGQRMLLARSRGDEVATRHALDDMAAARASLRSMREHPGWATGGSVAGGLANPINRILPGGATGGAIAGGTDRMGAEILKGSDADTIKDETAGGSLVGGVIGGGLDLLSRGFRGAGSAVSTTLRKYLQHKDAGTLPSLDELPGKGDVAYQQSADKALNDIMAAKAARQQKASAEYGAEVDPELHEPVPLGPIRRSLLEASVDTRTGEGGSVNPHTQDSIKKTFDLLGEHPTADDVLKVRRATNARSGRGSPAPTENQLADQDVYKSLNKGLEEANPRIAGADARYTEHKIEDARINDILGLDPENGPRMSRAPRATPEDVADMTPAELQMRVPDRKTALRSIKRMGDENVPGVEHQAFLDELSAMDPKFATALNYVEAVKAREATRFSLHPQEKLPFNAAAGNDVVNFALQNGRATARHAIDLADLGAANSPAVVSAAQGALREPAREMSRNAVSRARQIELDKERERIDKMRRQP